MDREPMTQQQTERDEALIAEKKRLADELERMYNGAWADDAVTLRHAAALLRGDEPAASTVSERDEALIAEAERLADNRYNITDKAQRGPKWYIVRDTTLIRLARENWTPSAKPDRYLEVWKEATTAWKTALFTHDCERDQAAAAVLRRHFEPSAEVVEAARVIKRAYKFPDWSEAAQTLADFILKGDQ